MTADLDKLAASLTDIDRECQAVWRCAVGDVTTALDALKKQLADSRKKADRQMAERIAPVLDLIWASRSPAPSNYNEAFEAGKAMVTRVRNHLIAQEKG